MGTQDLLAWLWWADAAEFKSADFVWVPILVKKLTLKLQSYTSYKLTFHSVAAPFGIHSPPLVIFIGPPLEALTNTNRL